MLIDWLPEQLRFLGCKRHVPARRRLSKGAGHEIESLELRTLLSASAVSGGTTPDAAMAYPLSEMLSGPFGLPGPSGLTPSQLRNSYGLTQLKFANGTITADGSGQTIAIVDAYDSPTIEHDLAAFDAYFGIAAPPSFTRVAQDGSTNYPITDISGGWEGETALDVEWAHAVAPGAKILLVEATDQSLSNLLAAARFAATQPGVSAVSMSFGYLESEVINQTSFDSSFLTPKGHTGVTFFASTGDSGAPASYPAYSPNVVAVGGTTLSIDGLGFYQTEDSWSGSGGGISDVEHQPKYQLGVQSTGFRTTPDVSFVADPFTGVAIYDTFQGSDFFPWQQIGGTSLSSPCWGGLMTIINQGRAVNGLDPLDGATQTLPMLYNLPDADFHDILTGDNGFPAGPGYDFVTGRGTPVTSLLVPALAGNTAVGTTFLGTAGNDVITFQAGSTQDSITINGVTQTFSSTGVTAVTIDSGTGNDVINVLSTGSGAVLTVISSGTATVNLGNAGSVQGIAGAVNVLNASPSTTVVVDDSADLTGRSVTFGTTVPAGDTAFGTITGLAPATIAYRYSGAAEVNVLSGKGNSTDTLNAPLTGGVRLNVTGSAGDTAIFNAAGNDSFVALGNQTQLGSRPYSYMYNDTGYLASVYYAGLVYGVAAAGGSDAANLLPAQGGTVVETSTYSDLYGQGYVAYALGFKTVYAYGNSSNVAYLLPAANGKMIANSAYGYVYDTGYLEYAAGFGNLYAYGDSSNTAIFYPSPNSVLIGTDTYAYVYGTGYVDYAGGFGSVSAFGSASDTAYFYLGTNDTFAGLSTYSYMVGNAFTNLASGFGSVNASGNSTNIAYLYDSPGNDTFVGNGNLGALFGTGFGNTVSGFGVVNAFSIYGGFDTLQLGTLNYVFKKFGNWH